MEERPVATGGRVVVRRPKTRKSRQITAVRLAQVAREYWIDGWTYRDIATAHKTDPSTVMRWIRRARVLGVVSFEIDALAGGGHVELPKLAEAVRDAYGLQDCTVVKLKNGPVDSSLKLLRDDWIHLNLAISGAARLKRRIESRDHIAVSGGRTIWRFADQVRRRPPSRRDITITPMAGRLWVGAWKYGAGHAGLLDQPLDADDVALTLAQAFRNQFGTSFSQIGLPLYSESPKAAEQAKAEHCAFVPSGKWNWNLPAPHRAYVGIGALAPNSGHRLEVLCRSSNQHGPDRGVRVSFVAERAGTQLREMTEVSERYGLPYAADICNLLYPVLPIPQVVSGTSVASSSGLVKLSDLLAKLNQQALVPRWDHIRDIRSVTAIAGGAAKRNAIWTALLPCLLQDAAPSGVTGLVTDDETATVLLKAKGIFDKDDKLRESYATAAQTAGLFGSAPRG